MKEIQVDQAIMLEVRVLVQSPIGGAFLTPATDPEVPTGTIVKLRGSKK